MWLISAILFLLACSTSTPKPEPEDTDTTVDTTDTDTTADTDTPCGALGSADCTVVDGECRDPAAGPGSAAPTYVASEVTAQLEQWRTRSGCGAFWVGPCGGSLVGVVFDDGGAGPSTNVYDATTGAWVGGYAFRDEVSPEDPCGARMWRGDPRALSCAEQGLTWLGTHAASCGPVDTDVPACEPACILDKRITTGPEACEDLSLAVCAYREGCWVARVHPYVPGEPGGHDPAAEAVEFCVTQDETDCVDLECTFQQPGGDCYLFPNTCRPVGWGDCPGARVCGTF